MQRHATGHTDDSASEMAHLLSDCGKSARSEFSESTVARPLIDMVSTMRIRNYLTTSRRNTTRSRVGFLRISRSVHLSKRNTAPCRRFASSRRRTLLCRRLDTELVGQECPTHTSISDLQHYLPEILSLQQQPVRIR